MDLGATNLRILVRQISEISATEYINVAHFML